MRNKGKITTQRSRDYGRTNLGKAKVKEATKVVFCQDLEVSSRILAILSKSVSKKQVQIHKREPYIVEFTRGNKQCKKTKYKITLVDSYNETEKYSVICGSNGKFGVRYNTVITPKGKSHLEETDIKKQGIIGKELDDKRFIELFDKQNIIFKNIFAEEYQVAVQRVKSSGK